MYFLFQLGFIWFQVNIFGGFSFRVNLVKMHIFGWTFRLKNNGLFMFPYIARIIIMDIPQFFFITESIFNWNEHIVYSYAYLDTFWNTEVHSYTTTPAIVTLY